MGLGECSHRGSRPDTGTRRKGAGRSARTDAPEPEPESARTNGPERGPLEPRGHRSHRARSDRGARTVDRSAGRRGAGRGARRADRSAGRRAVDREAAAATLTQPDGSLGPGRDRPIALRQHLRPGGSNSLVASHTRHVLFRGMGRALRESDGGRWPAWRAPAARLVPCHLARQEARLLVRLVKGGSTRSEPPSFVPGFLLLPTTKVSTAISATGTLASTRSSSR